MFGFLKVQDNSIGQHTVLQNLILSFDRFYQMKSELNWKCYVSQSVCWI